MIIQFSLTLGGGGEWKGKYQAQLTKKEEFISDL